MVTKKHLVVQTSCYLIYILQVFIQAIKCPLYGTINSIFAIEFWNSILILFVCLFVFAYLLGYMNSFAIPILEIKIKRHLHVSYMQFFDYLCIHNIRNILRYTRNENLKLEYLSQHQMHLINYFCSLEKGMHWIKGQCRICNKIHLKGL